VGAFNVFIGKNNSGKSTLLRAIRAFFLCLKRGNVIDLNPPIGRDSIDFSNRKTELPIEITARFSMQLAERDALIRDIASETPQLKNAVDGLDPSQWLEVVLRITAPPTPFAYTERVALIPPGIDDGSPPKGRILCQISENTAKELAERYREMRKSLYCSPLKLDTSVR
jgi:energy-coupling factor transporter ATP-binding protein EcfA2